MRSLLSAQHSLTQSLMRARNKELDSAKKFSEVAYREMSAVKDALKTADGGSLPVVMLKLFFDDLNRQRVDLVEKEILIQEKAVRASSDNYVKSATKG